MAQYSDHAYWDERYRKDREFFDWYQRWVGLKPIVKDFLSKKDEILILGCGRSRLSEDMYEDGYRLQTNVDFSSVAIEAMAGTYISKPSMKFKVADVTNMGDLATSSFDVAIDKGTLDSILCGTGSSHNATLMLREVSRVLRQNGHYICITYGEPKYRLLFLEKPELHWSVQVKTAPKPNVADGVTATLGADPNSKVHYIYICSKGATVHT